MTFMDRTREFNTAAESVRTKQMSTKLSKKSHMQQKSQFVLSAARIGQGIYDTSDKLQKLTKLTKIRGPFEDSSMEIGELTAIIKQNIQELNKEIASLTAVARPSSNKQNTANTETIVTFLNSKLAATTKDFKAVLQDRTESLKNQHALKLTFGVDVKSHNPSRSQSASSVLYKQMNLPDSPVKSGGEVAIAMPQMMALQQEDYTAQRASAVENIERTIVELGSIFQQLSSLVAEQGDRLQRIDNDLDNTTVYVERGQSELIKYLYNISSNRMLIVKLFLILIVFAVIFIVFFV